MGLLERLRPDGAVSLSSAQWAVLVGLLVVAVSIVTVSTGPGDQVRPANPQGEWTWSATTDGDVALTHEGGDSVDRASLRLVGEALADPVPDLGEGEDARIVQPFGDGVVSQGDALVIDGDALDEGSVALRWHDPGGDQSATLAHLDYPDDLDGDSRSSVRG